MSRLLSAGFCKLFKSSVFFDALVFMVGFPALVAGVRYVDMLRYPEYYVEPMDGFLNAGLMFIGFVTAVLISLFVGREYSDGVMRNKLIIGHSRASIYLSNLIISTVSSFILQLAYVITMYLFGRVIFGAFSIPDGEIVKMQLLGFCLTAAYAAIFTLIAMLIHSKSTAAVTALITAMVVFVYGMNVYQTVALEKMLNNPERYENAFMAVDVTEEESTEPASVLNDSKSGERDELSSNEIHMDETYTDETYTDEIYTDEYIVEPLTGTKKIVYEFLYDFLPSSQAGQISECVLPEHWDRFVLYDCGIVVFASMIGVLIFRKKDLK